MNDQDYDVLFPLDDDLQQQLEVGAKQSTSAFQQLDNSTSETPHPVDISDPTLASPAVADAENAARLWMTALKLFSPLFDAVITRPVTQENTGDMMMTFFNLLKSTNTLATTLTTSLQDVGRIDFNAPDNRWVLRQIIPVVTTSVATQWKSHGIVNDASLREIYQMVINTIHSGEIRLDTNRLKLDSTVLEVCLIEDRFIRVSPGEALTMSQLAAFQPLISEVSQFACWQDTNQLLMQLTTIVNENAEFLYFQQPEDLLSDRGRLVLLQACLKHAGAQTHASYQVYARSLLAEFNNADTSGKNIIRQQAASLPQKIADDVRSRCSLLHQAAVAGKASLDTLLRRVNPVSKPPGSMQL